MVLVAPKLFSHQMILIQLNFFVRGFFGSLTQKKIKGKVTLAGIS